MCQKCLDFGFYYEKKDDGYKPKQIICDCHHGNRHKTGDTLKLELRIMAQRVKNVFNIKK